MSIDANALVAFWSELHDQKPFIHPQDLPFRKLLQDCETSLFPQPWIGDIANAAVFVMQLNPGLSGEEIDIENSDAHFTKALRRNLSGSMENVFLDQRFATHPGRKWTMSKFGKSADLNKIKTKIALIELIPYHSNKKPKSTAKLAKNLPSSFMVKQFLHKNLLPRALDGEIGLIIQRAAKEWGCLGISDTKDFVVYLRNMKGKNPLGGFLTPSTLGGAVIQRHI